MKDNLLPYIPLFLKQLPCIPYQWRVHHKTLCALRQIQQESWKIVQTLSLFPSSSSLSIIEINHRVKTDEELKNFTRDYLNKPLSPAQLLLVATLITKHYAGRGFITSHAIVCIPKLTQQQGKGVVQIRVISGELDRIDEKLFPAFQEEKKCGAAQSFSTSLSFDTSLFSRLPTFQQKVVFSEANLLGIGDGLSVGYTHTEATNDWDISYTLPLNARDGTLSFAYSQSETYASESPSENIQEAGNSSGYELASRSYQLTLRQPVKRSFWGESDRFKEQLQLGEWVGVMAFLTAYTRCFTHREVQTPT